jgi:hypothetical protein
MPRQQLKRKGPGPCDSAGLTVQFDVERGDLTSSDAS